MKTTKMVVILVLVLGLAAEVANADFTFGTPTNLGPTVNSSAPDGGPSISSDGLALYFRSDRRPRSGESDLWVATRETKDDKWSAPVNLGPTVNSSAAEGGPSISTDGLSLFFGSDRQGWVGPHYTRDIWVTTRATTIDPWGEPVNLGPTVNTSAKEYSPSISADGLSLFFSYTPLGPFSHMDAWVTTRATTDDNWSTPVNLGPSVNSSALDVQPCISADGLTLYFHSDRPGGSGNRDLWQVPVVPVVDFNGDGIVDCADISIMVDHWGENYPLCDIGPTPFGDRIVDVQDLIVLAEHLFEGITLVE